MGRHTGTSRGHPRTARGGRSRQAVGLLATLVAWGVLVYAAIGFGVSVRGGQRGDWALLVLTTLGAAACLALGLVLGGRLVAARRSAPAARHSGGRRRVR